MSKVRKASMARITTQTTITGRSIGSALRRGVGIGGSIPVLAEMAAHANLLSDVEVLAQHARLAIIGSKPLPVALNPRLLMPKEVSLLGVFLPAGAADLRATHAALYESMAAGKLAPMVGAALPLADAAKAHVEVMAPSSGGKVGNIVLVVREE